MVDRAFYREATASDIVGAGSMDPQCRPSLVAVIASLEAMCFSVSLRSVYFDVVT